MNWPEQLNLFPTPKPFYHPKPKEPDHDFGAVEQVLVQIGSLGFRSARERVYKIPSLNMSAELGVDKKYSFLRFHDELDSTTSKKKKYRPAKQKGGGSVNVVVRYLRKYLISKRGDQARTLFRSEPHSTGKSGKLVSSIYFRPTDVPVNKQTAIVIAPAPKYLVKPEEVLAWENS